MAANNYFPDQPPAEPNETSPTRDWKVRLNEKVWALRSQHNNLYETVQNQGNNYTTLNQKVTQVTQNINNGNIGSKPPVIYGTHGLRLSQYPPGLFAGFLFVETDRFQATYYSNNNAWVLLGATGAGSFENRISGFNAMDTGWEWIETSRNNISGLPPYPLYRWDGSNWSFISGEFYRNQNQLAVLAGTFAANNSQNGNDIGARVNVTDFRGQLQWTNANNANGWALGPDDTDQHGMGPFFSEADRTGSWWQLYDGSNNITYLQANGTLGTIANLPNLSGNNAGNAAFLEAGQVNSGINPPVAPTLTMNSYTPAGTVPSGSGVTSNSANAVTSVTGVVGLITTSGSFVTSVSGGGGGGGNLNGTPATLTGSISNNGQPASLVRRAWFRR